MFSAEELMELRRLTVAVVTATISSGANVTKGAKKQPATLPDVILNVFTTLKDLK